MYPILGLGIFLIVATVRHNHRDDERQLALVKNLRSATLLIGFLGTTLGMIHCLMNLDSLPPGVSHGNIALKGLGEALNCVAFSLIMVATSVLISTVGAWRAATAR